MATKKDTGPGPDIEAYQKWYDECVAFSTQVQEEAAKLPEDERQAYYNEVGAWNDALHAEGKGGQMSRKTRTRGTGRV